MGQNIDPQMLAHLGQQQSSQTNHLSGRVGTTASNNSTNNVNISTYYSKGMTYPQLVGKKRINIDPAEIFTKVVSIKGCLNKLQLENNEIYYTEAQEDMEKQLGRFGTLKRLLILRNSNIEDWLRSGQYNNSTPNQTRDSSIKIEQESSNIGTVNFSNIK